MQITVGLLFGAPGFRSVAAVMLGLESPIRLSLKIRLKVLPKVYLSITVACPPECLSM